MGTGFALIENWFYFATQATPAEIGFTSWLGLLVYRSFFNTLAHGCFTAAIGATIGHFKADPKVARYAKIAFLPGLFIAIVLHAAFNIFAILDTVIVLAYEIPIFIFNPLLVATLALAFVVMFIIAMFERKHRGKVIGYGVPREIPIH